MGNTTLSITTVLTVFMGGLALGSYVGGRIIDRRKDMLRIFSLLEGAVGIYCLQLPWLINATKPLYHCFYSSTSFATLTFIRFVLCGLIILVPTTLMGATLPVLSRFLAGWSGRVGGAVGRLYAVNAVGAAIGAFCTGFVFIVSLGVTRTIYLACMLNFLVSAIAYLLHRKTRNIPSLAHEVTNKPPAHVAQARKPLPIIVYGRTAMYAVLIGYGLSGFAALVYEIAWTRALSLLMGSSVYAFSMMLAAFILGLAIGSITYARFADRVRDPMRALALMEAGISLSALAVVPLLGSMPFFMTGLVSRMGSQFWLLHWTEFVLIVLIVLVPTTLMGAAFPLACRLCAQVCQRVGRGVGTVYAYNTLGSILGSFLGGFLLIPVLGTERTILAMVAVNAMVGAAFLFLSRSTAPLRRGIMAGVSIILIAVGIAFVPVWNVAEMTSGPAIDGMRLAKDVAQDPQQLREMARQRDVIFDREDSTTTVTVEKYADGQMVLRVNGKPDASSSTDLPTQLMLAHVPMLLQENPRQVLVIGLASGITLGSASLYPAAGLDCVEISPAMTEACHCFDAYNHNVLADPRVHIVVSDGRNHVALTDKHYDVIISEPSNPWIAGIADLFTVEYFRLCRDRLTDKGVACIWLDTYHMRLETFQSVVRTFHSVFPNMTIWYVRGDTLLVGFKTAPSIPLKQLARRIDDPKIKEDLKRIGISSVSDFLGCLLMGSTAAGAFAQDGLLNTDDNAMLEFSAPKFDERNQNELQQALMDSAQADFGFIAGLGEPDVQPVIEQARRNIEAGILTYRASRLWEEGDRAASCSQLRQACLLNPSAVQLNEMAVVVPRLMANGIHLAQTKDIEKSLEFFETAAMIKGDDPALLCQVGDAMFQLNRFTKAIPYFRRSIELEPDWPKPRNDLAWILATNPDPAGYDPVQAVRTAQKACELTHYAGPGMLDTLAVAYAATGDFDKAATAAQQALDAAAKTRQPALAADIRIHLEMFKNHQAYRPGK
jgi:spermidine synthase